MEYKDLFVVAARRTLMVGIAINNPIVRTSGGKLFVLHDVNAESQTPDLFIPHEELAEDIRSGYFAAIPNWPAGKGKIVAVMSARFAALADKASVPFDESWHTLNEDLRAAYLPIGQIKAWQYSFTRRFLAWADGETRKWLTAKKENRLPQDVVAEPYRHARFLHLDNDADLRSRAQITLGVIFTAAGDQRRVEVTARLTARDYSIDPDKFKKLIDVRREKILTSSRT